MRHLGLFLFMVGCTSSAVIAGNKDRVGQSGAAELKINPWTQSSGFHSANSASAIGLEATSLNVSGLAFINKTEISFSSTSWLRGADIGINSFGLAQRIGKKSFLGIGIMSMSFRDIEVTTVNQPEGGELGFFSPSFLNLGLSYAKEFAPRIFGGITVRAISENIDRASARGVGLDAGIRYVTGRRKNIKFGIALRNVGPKMAYSGDGFSEKVFLNEAEFTLEQRTQGFELPTLMSIGVSYDYHIGVKDDKTAPDSTLIPSEHILSAHGNFTSNSFGKDQFMIGLEYAFRQMFKIRGGYLYEDGISFSDNIDMTSAFNGPSAGFSVELPLNKKNDSKSKLAIDYAYRSTISFDGTHSFGLRLML